MLKTPVQVLQKQTTTKEFRNWILYLDEMPNLFDPSHHYLAQIAYVIATVNTQKGKKKPKLEDFIITFEKVVKKVAKEMSPEEKEKAIARSKQIWMAAVGYGQSKKAAVKTKQGLISRTPPKKSVPKRK